MHRASNRLVITNGANLRDVAANWRGARVGTAPYQGAQAGFEALAKTFVPDGAHELLYDVHAVHLPAPVRAALLAQGFAAWG